MNRVNLQMRQLAKTLIDLETVRNKSLMIKNPDAFQVCEKLRPPLATLVGNEAFRALLAHALALASREEPQLSAVRVNADGTLEASEEIQAQIRKDKYFEGRVLLLAQLLGLLVDFIGEKLTVWLVREAWPKARVNHLDLGEGGIK